MLSGSQKKLINALKTKKGRNQQGLFFVEGVKMVQELLYSDFQVVSIFATSAWMSSNDSSAIEVTERELKSISSLKTPNQVLAIAKKRQNKDVVNSDAITLVLDEIKDPGNMGTIIRTADWFGIKNIVCSPNCVDIYNPKVIQATMGSLFHVNVIYTDLMSFFETNRDIPLYGALLDGDNVYQTRQEGEGSFVLLGNESKGISKNLYPFITHKISIPRHGRAESLNVASAAAIICAEFTRS